jgi:hypothetical protein
MPPKTAKPSAAAGKAKAGTSKTTKTKKVVKKVIDLLMNNSDSLLLTCLHLGRGDG